MTDIKTEMAKYLKSDFQIEESVTASLFENGTLQEHDAKKVLIKEEYYKKARHGEKQRLRNKLAEKYCVSISLVEKIVLQNT